MIKYCKTVHDGTLEIFKCYEWNDFQYFIVKTSTNKQYYHVSNITEISPIEFHILKLKGIRDTTGGWWK